MFVMHRNTKTGKVIRVVRMNTVLTAIGTDSETGWYKLSDGNYISNKYTCLGITGGEKSLSSPVTL